MSRGGGGRGGSGRRRDVEKMDSSRSREPRPSRLEYSTSARPDRPHSNEQGRPRRREPSPRPPTQHQTPVSRGGQDSIKRVQQPHGYVNQAVNLTPLGPRRRHSSQDRELSSFANEDVSDFQQRSQQSPPIKNTGADDIPWCHEQFTSQRHWMQQLAEKNFVHNSDTIKKLVQIGHVYVIPKLLPQMNMALPSSDKRLVKDIDGPKIRKNYPYLVIDKLADGTFYALRIETHGGKGRDGAGKAHRPTIAYVFTERSENVPPVPIADYEGPFAATGDFILDPMATINLKEIETFSPKDVRTFELSCRFKQEALNGIRLGLFRANQWSRMSEIAEQGYSTTDEEYKRLDLPSALPLMDTPVHSNAYIPSNEVHLKYLCSDLESHLRAIYTVRPQWNKFRQDSASPSHEDFSGPPAFGGLLSAIMTGKNGLPNGGKAGGLVDKDQARPATAPDVASQIDGETGLAPQAKSQLTRVVESADLNGIGSDDVKSAKEARKRKVLPNDKLRQEEGPDSKRGRLDDESR